jgi:hypothetical protein
MGVHALIYTSKPQRAEVKVLLKWRSFAVERGSILTPKTSIIVMADSVRAVLPDGFVCPLSG